MKKLLALLLAVLLLSTSVSALAADEPVTIQFANYAILEAGYEPFWNGIKAGFEAQYPNYKIEWVTAPYGEIVTQVVNMAGGGNKPDVIFSELSWVSGLEDAGLAVPVDSVLSADYLADFYPAVMDNFKVGDKVYGLPMYISPFVLYYNKDLFTQAGLDPNAPPKTFDEMLVAAEALSKLTSADGNKVYAFGQTTAAVPISGSALTAMIYNFGGSVLDAEGKLSVDNEGFTKAFEMLKTLDEKGYNPQNAKLKDLRNLFALGQLAMYYDQSWGFNGVKTINPEAVNFTASAKPLAGGAGNGSSLLQAQCLVYFNNDPAKAEALQALTQYLVSTEQLGGYISDVTPAYPACKSMEGVTLNPVLAGAAGSGENVTVLPMIPRLNDLNLELTTLAQAVTVGAKDVATAIADFVTVAAPMTEE